MKVSARVYSRAVVCALLSQMAVAWTASAGAQTVTVTAKGAIAPSCSMAAMQNFSGLNFTTASSGVAKASITCNQTFKMTATSANGLVKSNAPAVNGFGNTLPYSLKADLALDDGSVRTATCGSATLVAGQSTCTLSPVNSTGLTSNGQIATNKTTNLTLSWNSALLVPGSYSDTLTLTIAVTP